MKTRSYEVIRQCYCDHAGAKVTLESQYVEPSDFLPDGPARLHHRDCSHQLDCNLQDKSACTYAISMPGR